MSNTWVLELELVKDAQLTIDSGEQGKVLRDALKDTSRNRTYKVRCAQEMLAQTIQLNCTGNKLRQSRYVKLIIPNPDSHKHISLDRLAETFEGKFVDDAKVYAADFMRDLRRAVDSERETEDEDPQKLVRNDVTI